jgi:hypothetical protein
MRLVSALLACAAFAVAQQPVGIGPSQAANAGLGLVKFFDWYTATPTGGCVNGANGACVGHSPQGDTYYWSAWLPNASGLPVTTGLPVVGTANDESAPGCSGGNIALLQLDTWSWAAPTTSHITRINCMTSFGTAPGASNTPAGWNGHLTSSDSVGNAGTWKSRTPFSKGGILYLPVERQISAGGASVHDATFIMSPDSGVHWCNPYTYFSHSGSPGCDSSNWQADGDAPKCDSVSSSTLCLNTGYLDATHSSIMFHALPVTMDNWVWINYLTQDGAATPSGISDGCDPASYTCFIGIDGSLARVPNASSILDVSAWRYYTCSTITQNYRCAGSDSANWTATLANRTPVIFGKVYGGAFYQLFPVGVSPAYLKEFGAYVMGGVTFYSGTNKSVAYAWAPAIQGPWTRFFQATDAQFNAGLVSDFLNPTPALGYNVISTNPPRVQLTWSSNSYLGGEGSPQMHMWDFVSGRNMNSEAFQSGNALPRYVSGAGFQFSDGHMPGSFPRNGLVWSFDFLDEGVNSGVTNWPYFVDRGNQSAVMVPCNDWYASTTSCGSMNPGRGTSMNAYGITTIDQGYGGHFHTAPFEASLGVLQNAPPAMQGNGSYSVVGVYRYEAATQFSRRGAIWATGYDSSSDNTMLGLNQVNGRLELDWNATDRPHYRYLSNFTFPNFTNWYFIAVTVQAQTSCGSNCTPTASVWVGGAVTPDVLTDAIAGVSYMAAGGTTPAVSTRTPNVSVGPLVLGMNTRADTYSGNGEATSMTTATTMVYSRALTYPEVQMMYRSMKAKMAERGVTLQ